MNKQNLTMDFIVDKENKTITIKREFAAGLQMVWDAYTKSEILDLWWAPKPWKARTKSMEFKVGGKWLYAMVGPSGEEHWAIAEYKEIVPLKKFIGDDAFTDSEGNINPTFPKSHWEVSFKATGELTLVEYHVSYSDLAQLEATIEMGFKEGITIAMEGLDALFASN